MEVGIADCLLAVKVVYYVGKVLEEEVFGSRDQKSEIVEE